MKRKILAVIISSAMLLTACGSKENTTADEAGSDTVVSEATDVTGESVSTAANETAAPSDRPEPKKLKFGTRLIPSDTKSLYVSTRDMEWGAMEDIGAYLEYDRVVWECEDVLDCEELAHELPQLEKLFIGPKVRVENITALNSMAAFEKLQINFSTPPDLDGLDVKELMLSDNIYGTGNGYEDVSFLENAEADELTIFIVPNQREIDNIARLDNVTELFVDMSDKDEAVDLSPISGMKNLKKLTVGSSPNRVFDVSVLEGMDELTELRIAAPLVKNLDSIASLKGLKKLSLYQTMTDDMSFLSELDGVEELTLVEPLEISVNDLQGMASLKKLIMYDGTGVTNEPFSIDSLEELYLIGCGQSDLSALAGCGSLRKLIFCSLDDIKPFINAEDVLSLPKLDTLGFMGVNLYNGKSLEKLTGLSELGIIRCNTLDFDAGELGKNMPSGSIVTDDVSILLTGDIAIDPELRIMAVETKTDTERFTESYAFGDMQVYKVEYIDGEEGYTAVNFGSETISAPLDIMAENGLFDQCENIHVRYPAAPDDPYSGVVENIPVVGGKPDYANAETFLSVLYDGEYDESGSYRSLQKGMTVTIILTE